ncbi:MAG: UPF0149 family protein [Holosporaceae bacterium]|jgi:yecA family protein|nr:UPF0149 family protein [Holosporaceae bacterium]
MSISHENESFEPLSNKEIDELKSILSSHPNAPSFEIVDGFFVGSLCSPYELTASSCIPKIISSMPEPSSKDPSSIACALMVRYWYNVENRLQSGDFKPIFGDGPNRGAIWAQGFMQGIDLSESDLDELAKDEETSMLLIPFLSLAYSGLPYEDQKRLGLKGESDFDILEITPELKKELIEVLPYSVMTLYSMFGNDLDDDDDCDDDDCDDDDDDCDCDDDDCNCDDDKCDCDNDNGDDDNEDDIVQKPRRHIKVGPDEQCLCGSGKKFKKCCLNKTEK